jgi:hypothetical protein
MNREDWKEDAPKHYVEYKYEPIKMTDKEIWEHDLDANYEAGVKMSEESEH